MKIVSTLMKRVVYPSLSTAGLLRRSSAAGLTIITYHGVVPQGYVPVDPVFDGSLVSTDTLRTQLHLLKADYNLISPDDALAWLEGRLKLPQRAVLLTCDDGRLNCLTDMLPVLRSASVNCLFFVTTPSGGASRTMLWYEELFLLFLRAPAGRFEIPWDAIVIKGELGTREGRRALWWNSVKRLSQIDAGRRASFIRASRTQFGLDSERTFDEGNSAACRRFGLLTWAELHELASAGMSIGSHTLHHPMLSQAPAELAFAEVSESRTQLEAALQRRVWAFAYPFGDPQSVTPQVLAMPQKAGYEAAFVNFGGGLDTALPPYALPRVHVTAEMSLAEFEAHVSGFHARLRRRVRRTRPLEASEAHSND